MENIDKYIEEMRLMRQKAKAPENTENMGSIRIAVTTLGGTYPIKNATVKLFKGSGQDGDVLDYFETDNSGLTPVIMLPAPEISISFNKNSTVRPYALYNVTVSADGYIDRTLTDLSVFSGVESLLRVDLTPVSQNNKNQQGEVIDDSSLFDL